MTTVATRRRARVRLLDAAVATLDRAGLARTELDGDAQVAAARARTGLEDLGDPSFRAGLDAYLASLRDEAALSPLGRLMAGSAVTALLENRLRIEHDLAADPAVLGTPVRAPIVIVGLPRSGTTLLQHVLAHDPANRSLRHWEAAHPSPPPGDDDGGPPDPRIARTARDIRRLYRLVPEARTIHPQYAELPTECVSLLATSFASFELATMHAVPGYLDWLLGADLRPAYEEHRRTLHLLQSRRSRERWVLKSPAHLFALDALMGTYPDARLVFLWRDPRQVLGSFCSLATLLAQLGSRRVDTAALGRRWLGAWATAVRRAEAARDLIPAEQRIDLVYDELVGDPLTAVRRIYDRFDLPLPPTAAEAMSEFLRTQRRHRNGTHRYALGDFGLDGAQVDRLFDSWTGVRA